MIRYSFIATILSLTLLACSANRKSRVAAPIRDIDVPFQVYRFQADSGASFRLPTGTNIKIEPGSLVDAKGNAVRGEVEFRVREFHRAEDLFRAGIPMDTRANGTDRLQSAGMIEMRAYANDQELSVVSGRSIGVGLADYRNAKEYDLWYMDGDADWNKRGSFTTDSNRIKIQTIGALTDSLNKMKTPTDTDPRIFELVGNVKEVPYLKAYTGVTWRLDDSQPIDVLQVQSRILWEGVRIKRVNKKNNLYELTFIQYDRDDPEQSKGIQKTILAQALNSRSDMRARSAEYEKELAAFEQLQNQRREELARAKREADLIQSFRADRLGIWNLDRLMKMEDCIPVYVRFDFEKELDKESKVRLFALYDGENSIMEFRQDQWGQVYLQKGKAMRLVALLPNEKVAIVSDAAIQSALLSSPKEVNFQTERKEAKEFLKTSTP